MRKRRRRHHTDIYALMILAASGFGVYLIASNPSILLLLFIIVIGIPITKFLADASSNIIREKRFRSQELEKAEQLRVLTAQRLERSRHLQLENIDTMDGLEFERYVGYLLESQGYNARVTKGSGDYGVDIIARRNGLSYAVQCKRYVGNVSRTAVSDVVAGKLHYRCEFAMVVTNGHFTPGARILAESTQCILIDRNQLAGWVKEFREKSAPQQVAITGEMS